MIRLALIGGGAMGGALLHGLLDAGWAAPTELSVAEPDDERRESLQERYGVHVYEEAEDAARGAGCVLLAVKQPHLREACEAVGAELGAGTPVASIVAGVSTRALEAMLPERTPVVRAMPNTGALVGMAMSVVAGGRHATGDHLDLAEEILGAVGRVLRVEESLLDVATAVSGSGPAYFFYLVEALAGAGVALGLPEDTAAILARQTMAGAAGLLETGRSATELRTQVTSPGGTTAAAVAALDACEVRAGVLAAVRAATARGAELGRQFEEGT